MLRAKIAFVGVLIIRYTKPKRSFTGTQARVSYEPLHHKYRPQIFEDLVGQEAIATTLTNAIATQRIAPAYLFTGPRGTGKTSSARIFAKSLNCIQSPVPTAQPCGKCQVCLSITGSYAVDVIEIDAASNTGVDNIRDVIERAQFAPVQCRHKVYVIDECHMLSTAAFNSLLKTLEEPPDRVVFVLATTDPQRVLPTIISRCQRFDFRRIPLNSMVQHLQYIAAQEKINISADAITLVAQVAQGGLRDAESLLDQLSLLTVEVTIEKVWDLIGTVPEQDLLALTKAIASNNSETVLDHCRRLMDRGREPLIVLQNLASFYRDLLIALTAPKRRDLVALTTTTWDELCEFAKTQNVPQILQGAQHLKTSEAQIKNTTQPRLWLEVTLLGLLPPANTPAPVQSFRQENRETPAPRNLAATSPSTSVPNTATNGGSKTQTTPAPEASPPDSPISPQPPTAESSPAPRPSIQQSSNSNNDIAQTWQQVLAHLSPSNRALFSQHGHLLAFNGQQAQIGIHAPKLIKMAQPRLPELQLAFQKALKQEVKVILITNLSGVAQAQLTEKPSSTEPQAVPLEAKEEMANDSTTASPPYHQPMPTLTGVGTQAPHLTVRESIREQQPAPPLVSDWNEEEVEEALGNIQKFFEGELVDLSDDFLVNEAAIIEQPPAEKAQKEESFSAAVATLQTPMLTIQDSLTRQNALEAPDLIEPVTSASPQSTADVRRLEVPPAELEDDDDIPF
ncbi:DNA polymerase III subunits gamma and tau [uncultured Coleofasciculus sp.]|uniref:DNA polymerase III subunit gamma/tau n=1 Tax=uncultured Coleofasciculus sp. TaxID=1267456 RepID=A0A6J4HV96_9CYAN|nr:DNA polymerase III subunits gamma and tau [uncultured Coleofasciculus sp.]